MISQMEKQKLGLIFFKKAADDFSFFSVGIWFIESTILKKITRDGIIKASSYVMLRMTIIFLEGAINFVTVDIVFFLC